MNENLKTVNNKNAFNLKEQFEQQLDIQEILSQLYGNAYFIGIVIGICFFIAVGVILVKPAQYTANVLVQVEQQKNGISSIDKTAMLMGSSIMYGQQASLAEIQSVLIKSRYILAPVVQHLGLDLEIVPAYFPFFGKAYVDRHQTSLAKPFLGLSHYAWGGELLAIDQFIVPLNKERKHFTLVALPDNNYALYDANKHFILKAKVGEQAVVKKQDGIYLITVKTLTANPNTHFDIYKKSTQQIINQLAKQLTIEDLGQGKQSKTGVLSISMINHNPKYLVSVLNEVAQVAMQKDIEKKTSEATKTLAFLNQQLPIVRQSLDEAETALNNYRAKTGTIDLDEESKVLLEQMSNTQKDLVQLQVERAGDVQKYTSSHPYILALNDKEKALRQALIAEQLKISKLPASDQAAVSLLRDVRVKSQLYLILLNKIQALQVTKAGTISDFRILALADFPDASIPLPKILMLLGSLIFGLLLGCMIVLIRHALHKKVSDPSVMEQQFGLTNMAIVPYSAAQAEIITTYNPKLSLLPLLAKSKPKDLSMEALRSLRTSLKFAMMDATNNVITIMGVAPGVGKSFISANFAFLMADAGQKVLLIDGDIRKGHLKDYFKVGSSKGLSEIIAGETNFEEVVIKGPIEKLDFLATGTYPPNPSELLMNRRFKELVDQVSKEYDLVIIDTPPILAVTDSAVIAHHAATNFMVIAAGVHDSGEIELAIKRLSANGVKLNGTIFNFSKIQSLYGYGYNYGYNNYGYKYQYKY